MCVFAESPPSCISDSLPIEMSTPTFNTVDTLPVVLAGSGSADGDANGDAEMGSADAADGDMAAASSSSSSTPAPSVALASLQPPSTLLVLQPHPSSRRWYDATGFWSDMDFHPNLRLPEGLNFGMGMQVTFEAKGSEGLLLCLSPVLHFDLGRR